MARSVRLRLVILAVIPLTACARPSITSLDQPRGPPHAVVAVQGTNLELSTIVWDAGSATEHHIPVGFLGAFMFSVPPDASLGKHQVAVENSYGRSSSVTFTVQAPSPLLVTKFPK